MTLTEFDNWVQFHNSCYDGFEAWLLGDPSEGERNRRDIWYETLGPFTLDVCQKASMDLVRRPLEFQPSGYSKHLNVLLLACRTKRDTESFTPQATRYAHVCGLCGNTGRLHVRLRHGEFVTTVTKTRVGPEGVVACACAAGDKFPNFLRFNRDTMQPRAEYDPAPTRDECLEIIAEHRRGGHHAYAARLERFLNGGSVANLDPSTREIDQ